MNNIIKNNGEYMVTQFTGDNGTWNMVCSECIRDSALECKDTFKNTKTGERITATRLTVLKQAESGQIYFSEYI